ncbi:thiolase family protein [Salinibius halmophilus]|uniref:thiolase family protein n=1 Tax=Salinibius halmophilus TaxID=1853216 RepID=UPI000E6765FE|nr:beta-ketoacyl synthase N-terminal-like domain-containing protein [Salinibius halmophilus]
MSCYLIGAERSLIAPANGLHKQASLADLTRPLLQSLAALGRPEQIILGNALGAGGNPARYCALDAGLCVPSSTIDTQCCSGLDSMIQAIATINAGQADLVFAGGVESYSQRPKRLARTQNGDYQAYLRPAFSPNDDVDMSEAAAALANARGITRQAQHEFAKQSHNKAAKHPDPAQRTLTDRLLARLPVIVGDNDYGLTSASIALEADGAAIVALASERYLQRTNSKPLAKVIASQQATGSAKQPALVPIECVKQLLAKQGLRVQQIDHWQIMEAYAVQAMVTIADLGIDPSRVNERGGALARGHAIAASGTVLAVEACRIGQPGDLTVCTIAAGGGLASALLLEIC